MRQIFENLQHNLDFVFYYFGYFIALVAVFIIWFVVAANCYLLWRLLLEWIKTSDKTASIRQIFEKRFKKFNRLYQNLLKSKSFCWHSILFVFGLVALFSYWLFNYMNPSLLITGVIFVIWALYKPVYWAARYVYKFFRQMIN